MPILQFSSLHTAWGLLLSIYGCSFPYMITEYFAGHFTSLSTKNCQYYIIITHFSDILSLIQH